MGALRHAAMVEIMIAELMGVSMIVVVAGALIVEVGASMILVAEEIRTLEDLGLDEMITIVGIIMAIGGSHGNMVIEIKVADLAIEHTIQEIQGHYMIPEIAEVTGGAVTTQEMHDLGRVATITREEVATVVDERE